MQNNAAPSPVEDIPNGKVQSQAAMLQNRLQKRYRHLKKWAKRIGTDVFRLYDRDIPEIPLVLDRYGEGVSGALYRRPYEKDEAEERHWLAAMTRAIAAALEIPVSQVFLKERKRQRGMAQYDKQAPERQVIRDVHEGGLRFRVNLSDYLDTGLFPDRRKMRHLIRETAAGKRVLNLFCYTAAFSVYAAAGGAAEIDSVDMSNTYLDWAAVNFALNRFEAARIETAQRRLPRYRLIRADVRSFLARAAGLSWDTIILDPPSFSNSKRMQTDFDLRRDYRELIRRCLDLLSPGGTLWFSANTKGFHLKEETFPGIIVRSPLLMDEDFRGKRIPACYILSMSN